MPSTAEVTRERLRERPSWDRRVHGRSRHDGRGYQNTSCGSSIVQWDLELWIRRREEKHGTIVQYRGRA